jgi:PAS domain S-box-containing protein
MYNLFHFTFQNPGGFFMAFIPGMINLAVLIYIVVSLPQNKLTNVFALFSLTLFCWQMNDAIGRICTTAQSADTWDSIFAFAWSFMAPLGLHFSLLYSKKIKEGHSRMLLILIYLPAFLFMSIYQLHLYPHIFEYRPFWGWVNNHNHFLLDKIYVNWIAALVITGAIILVRYSYSIKNDALLKKQSILITIGIVVPTLIGLIAQIILPVVLHKTAMPITSTSMTIFSFTTLIALRKYKLFSAAELITAETLIEYLPVMVFSLSDKGRVTYMNTYCLNALGLQKDDIPKLDITTIFRHESAEEEEVFQQAWNKSMKGEPIALFTSTFITPGEDMAVILSSNPIVNNRMVQGVLFVARDVTELKKKEKILEAKNEELQKINTELDKFVYSVSHDLRAPLTSVLGIVEIAEEDKPDDIMLEYLNIIKENIKKLDHFILDILDYSRNSRMNLKIEEINFEELLNDTIFNLKFANGNLSKPAISFIINRNAEVFKSDKRRLSVVLSNLISNAIRYSNPNSENPYTHIQVNIHEHTAEITVEDNGIGIDPDLHEKIFEMFFRAAENSKGSGIGLYIVKEAVQKLNGKIHVKSEPGKGTTFKLSIPNN